ncbi:DUF2510 domain-containing protein [Cellulomonas xylanilytica]|uniref:DUF2510 domain-containing protein n=1 Tax=Cellulomonas xylanilytica TaxID=233583 RepID=A0A510V0T1_9CELL|nr:DUF2510 domain-containing protein [Cellulomonas xylanilytica]GEK20502.1 hypothetical protein CXY01_10220 [Cellulomonas xylanilytica]
MDAVAPSWYPDPQRDGMLRWWDGSRWTKHVQPSRSAGRPVLGQEVTPGVGPVTFYGPDEPITHAFAPITDERYAGSPLADALAQHVRADRGSGDVQIPVEHHAAVEAVYQLRARGGVLGAVAGVGEQLVAQAIAAGPSTEAAAPGWMAGPGATSTVPGMSSPAGRAGYRAVGGATRGALGALALWRLVVTAGLSVLFVVGGLVLAITLPPALPFAVALLVQGALMVWLTVREVTRRREPGPV